MTLMDHDLHHTIIKAQSLLSACPCEYAEIRLSTSRGTTISLSADQVETFSAGDTIGGSVRTLFNGTWGFVSFNSLDNLERHFTRCLQLSSIVHPVDKTRIRRRDAVRRFVKTEMKKDIGLVSFDEKFNLINAYNTILRSSKCIQTTRATYRDLRSYYAYLNSEGSEITYDKAFCGIALASISRDGSVIQPFHDSVSGYGGYELAEHREDMAERVAKTAVDLLTAESAPGGTYRVVADQKLAGVFIHEAFGHLSEADFVHENERLRAVMTLGKQFGTQELTVIDNGSLAGLPGYIPFDDEGVASGETCLIKNGHLNGRLHSRETAEKMDEAVTGNARAINVMKQPIVRMTNTYIENGVHDREAIMHEAGNGIYAMGNIGGETNLEMFTFTAGCGYEIRNGKPGKMYKDIVLSGNVFTTLGNIAMIGNDRMMFGGLGGCGKGGQSPLPVSFGGPHMLINNVMIGGAQ